MDSYGSGYSLLAGFCECGYEKSVSVKYGKFWEQLSDCKFLNTYYASRIFMFSLVIDISL